MHLGTPLGTSPILRGSRNREGPRRPSRPSGTDPSVLEETAAPPVIDWSDAHPHTPSSRQLIHTFAPIVLEHTGEADRGGAQQLISQGVATPDLQVQMTLGCDIPGKQALNSSLPSLPHYPDH